MCLHSFTFASRHILYLQNTTKASSLLFFFLFTHSLHLAKGGNFTHTRKEKECNYTYDTEKEQNKKEEGRRGETTHTHQRINLRYFTSPSLSTVPSNEKKKKFFAKILQYFTRASACVFVCMRARAILYM